MIVAKYKRVLLKLSGESLTSHDNQIYNKHKINSFVKQFVAIAREGIELAIVIGGGNIWRGSLAPEIGMKKISGDYLGMLATCMNALALESLIQQHGYAKVTVCSALEMNNISEPFYFKKVNKKLASGHILLLAAGLGQPYFTTDSAAALRAVELDVDVILMAKNGVDGIYSSDPNKDPHAQKYEEISLSEIFAQKLKVMDLTASTIAREAKLNMIVFDANKENNIYLAACGAVDGTKVKGE